MAHAGFAALGHSMRHQRREASVFRHRAPKFLLLALGILTLSCADRRSGDSSAVESPSLGEINVQQLHDTLNADPDIMLVEVRTREEWETVRATGIKRFIPHGEIPDRHTELGVSKQTPVYVICRSGRRSGIAGNSLIGLGYTHVINVRGGTNAWVEAGFPTESGPVAVSRDGEPR